MALVRLDIPGLILYGGSIAPGQWEGHDVTIQDVFKVVGSARRGQDHGCAALRPGGLRLPGSGRVWWAVNGQQDVNRL